MLSGVPTTSLLTAAVQNQSVQVWRVSDNPCVVASNSFLVHHSCYAAEAEKVDGRAVRRSLNATGRYVRQPTKDEKSQELMEEHGECSSSSNASRPL
jgi:hypothetical protein